MKREILVRFGEKTESYDCCDDMLNGVILIGLVSFGDELSKDTTGQEDYFRVLGEAFTRFTEQNADVLEAQRAELIAEATRIGAESAEDLTTKQLAMTLRRTCSVSAATDGSTRHRQMGQFRAARWVNFSPALTRVSGRVC